MFFFSMVSCYKVVHFIFFWSIVILRTTDGASVTWYEPPPVESSSDHNKELIAYSRQLLKGSTNVQLRWNFSVTPVPITIDLTLNGKKIAFVAPSSGDAGPVLGFEGRFNATWISQRATLIIFNVTEDDDGEFGCELNTFQGGANKIWKRKMKVEVVVQSSITGDSGTQTGIEGSNVTLFCNVSGKPDPNVTWTMENGSDGKEVFFGNPWVIENISRNDTGTYRCTAYNGIEGKVSRLLYVNVTYPPKIVISRVKREREVAAQESVTLSCVAEGNPQPNYTWTPCDPQQSVCHESKLIIREVFKDINYTCRVENVLGSDTADISVVIASDVINVTLFITSEECTDGEYNQLWEKLRTVMKGIFAGKMGYESVQQKNIRCGSVIVDLALKFNSTVREREVLSILRNAVKIRDFGGLNVSAITGTRVPQIKTTVATTPTSSSDSTTWIIVGVVLGVAFLLVVTGVVAWYVYTKRKCKKRDSKEVHNNGPQGEEGGNVKNEGYVEVNSGYEGGNRSSVPPVVYDTAQTGNKRAAQGPPEYAVVDKSKRNPKKKKPGELQYAELAEFSAGQGGPRSSTSPTNRSTEIQYADVNAM